MKHEAISYQNHSVPYIYLQIGEFGQQALNGDNTLYKKDMGTLSFIKKVDSCNLKTPSTVFFDK